MKLTLLDTNRVSASAKKMMDFLKSRIVGQDRALRYLVSAAERAHSRLRDKRKPIASLLFLGPSGVGKTETARALAEYLFGNREAVAYIDCTKFTEPHSVYMLKGAPPSYLGFKRPGEDPHGEYPLLSHWNIYKHHFQSLEKLHQADQDALFDEWLEVEDLRVDVALLAEKIKRAQKALEQIKSDIEFYIQKIGELKKDKANDPELKKLQAWEDRLASAKQRFHEQLKHLEEMKKERAAKQKEYSERFTNGERAVRAAANAGWIYDDDDPSKNLMAVVIFDEIEKSAVEMRDGLMEIIDTGTYHLENGVVTPFHNAFVIMTSNIGQDQISSALNENSQIGFRTQNEKISPQGVDKRIYEIAMSELKKQFRPEFINRFDKIVVFRPLNDESMDKIFDIRITEMLAEFAAEKCDAKLEFDPKAKKRLLELSMKRTEEGARLLRKRLTDYIRDKMVVLFNTDQIKAGDVVLVKLGDKNTEFLFYKKET